MLSDFFFYIFLDVKYAVVRFQRCDYKDGWLGAASLTHETAPGFVSLSEFVEIISFAVCAVCSSTAVSHIL